MLLKEFVRTLNRRLPNVPALVRISSSVKPGFHIVVSDGDVSQ